MPLTIADFQYFGTIKLKVIFHIWYKYEIIYRVWYNRYLCVRTPISLLKNENQIYIVQIRSLLRALSNAPP